MLLYDSIDGIFIIITDCGAQGGTYVGKLKHCLADIALCKTKIM